MVSRPDAELNLANLLSHAPGADSDVEAEGLLEPTPEALEELGLRVEGPLAWRVAVRNTGGDDDFIVTGEVEGTAVIECRRCLTEVPTPVHSSFAYPMIYKPGADELTLIEDDEADEDLLAFGRPSVDFAPLLTQVFAIDQPLTALCREDCRGLSVDGVNLNEHPDHEAPRQTEPEPSPFAVLKDLDL